MILLLKQKDKNTNSLILTVHKSNFTAQFFRKGYIE